VPVTRNRGPGTGDGLYPTAPQVGVGAAGVGERNEHVVVEPRGVVDAGGAVEPGGVIPVVHLGVHGAHRSEELEGLVDEVAAEVEQGAAAGGRGTVLSAFEAGLEPGDGAEGAAVGEGADGAEVGVPPPVLVDREWDAEPLGQLDGGAGVRRGEREGLVDDDGQAELERLTTERDVGVGGGGHRDGLGSGGDESGEVVGHHRTGMLSGHERPPLGGPGRDRDELAPDPGGDQRGVEVAGPEAVANYPKPHRGDPAPQRIGTHPHRFPLRPTGNLMRPCGVPKVGLLTCGDPPSPAIEHDRKRVARLLYLIFNRLLSWLILLGRTSTLEGHRDPRPAPRGRGTAQNRPEAPSGLGQPRPARRADPTPTRPCYAATV
jgi:hypothetical protein